MLAAPERLFVCLFVCLPVWLFVWSLQHQLSLQEAQLQRNQLHLMHEHAAFANAQPGMADLI